MSDVIRINVMDVPRLGSARKEKGSSLLDNRRGRAGLWYKTFEVDSPVVEVIGMGCSA